jgi:hypothetical protein
MSWNVSKYNQFLTFVEGIENPLALHVRVDPVVNQGANLLCVYTGTVILGKITGAGFEGPTSSDWSRGLVKFIVPTDGRIWTSRRDFAFKETFLHAGTVVVSLASVFNKGVANNAGWAVDGADLQVLDIQSAGLRIEAKLAVRDSDGFIHRLSYQVTALGQEDRQVIGPV